MIRFHPHGYSINHSMNEVKECSTIAEFIVAVQHETSDIPRVTKSDITFHESGRNRADCSDAFLAIRDHLGWPRIYAVSVEVERDGQVICCPVGYSDQAFGPWVG